MKTLLLFILIFPIFIYGQEEEKHCGDRIYFTPAVGGFYNNHKETGGTLELGLARWGANWYSRATGSILLRPNSDDPAIFEVGIKTHARFIALNLYEYEPRNYFSWYATVRYSTKEVIEKDYKLSPWVYGGGVEYNIRLTKDDPYSASFIVIYAEYTQPMKMGGFRLGVNISGIVN